MCSRYTSEVVDVFQVCMYTVSSSADNLQIETCVAIGGHAVWAWLKVGWARKG